MSNVATSFPAFTAVSDRLSSNLGILLNSAEKTLDFMAVVAAVYAAYSLHLLSSDGRQAPYAPSALLLYSAAFALLFVIQLERRGGYRTYVSLLGIRETERVLRVSLQTFLLVLFAVYFCEIPVPPRMLLFALLTVPLFLALEKWELRHLFSSLRTRGYITRRAVILGTGSTARRIYSALVRSPKFGLDPVALVDDSSQPSPDEIYESSYERKRPVRVLATPLCPELFRQLGASVLIIATETSREPVQRIAGRSVEAGIATYFVPGEFLEPEQHIHYEKLDGILLAHVSSDATRVINEFAKRSFDVVLSAAALFCFAPLFGIVAVLIKLSSPGPTLFRQFRVGKDGRVFSMYKFRTMHYDAPQYGYSPKTGADPRITRIGRILRSTSLDELPQLFNVLTGQMSLVGPRPEMPFIVEQYTPLQRQRLCVKPGLTGLWQISADRASRIHEHMEYDLYYIHHRSLFMDIAILLHSFVFAPRGV